MIDFKRNFPKTVSFLLPTWTTAFHSLCSFYLKLFIFIFLSLDLLASPFKVGLVLDKGGKDDKSFNSAAFEGATRAQKELGIDLKYVEATDINALESLHRAFARKNFDLIIGVGFTQADAIRKVSPQFPDRKFVIIDSEVKNSNVRSIMFQEHEGAFLAGALAALKSQGQPVGFIGGMDIPLMRRFALGFETGVKTVSPKTKSLQNFIGVTGDAWNNPAKAKELALAQYNQNAQVIFVAAGASNSGVFDAAEEKKKLAIGVDSNQNWMKPNFILTSMMKRVDLAVYDTISLAQKNQFKAEVVRYGLQDKGIELAIDQHNASIYTPELQKKIEELKAQIIAGKIKVPDYYLTQGQNKK